MAVAKQFGFAGTPSFFLNTTHFGGAYSFKDMQTALDQVK
jgi:protein-disulfide isomerase